MIETFKFFFIHKSKQLAPNPDLNLGKFYEHFHPYKWLGELCDYNFVTVVSLETGGPFRYMICIVARLIGL